MRIWLAIGALGLLPACGSTEAESVSNSSSDAGPDGPEPRRLRRLTLCPIFDMSNTAGSAGKAVPASRVEVCVRRARPVGGTLKDWDDFDGTPPCTTSVAGESVVLDGIPELSELVVTFSALGYVPSAYAVVTGPGDTDAPKLGYRYGCGRGHWLYRTDALTWLDPAVVPSFELGIVAGSVAGLVGGPTSARAIELHDARVTIFDGQEPDAHTYTNGAGPFFSFNGVYCPEATSTIAPTDEELGSPDAGAPPELPGFAGFSFAQLVEGEYRLEIALEDAVEGPTVHPKTFCRTWGSLLSPIFGFQSASSGVVAPVLPGHVTFVSTICNCRDRGVDEIDPRTCSTYGVPVRPCRATTP